MQTDTVIIMIIIKTDIYIGIPPLTGKAEQQRSTE